MKKQSHLLSHISSVKNLITNPFFLSIKPHSYHVTVQFSRKESLHKGGTRIHYLLHSLLLTKLGMLWGQVLCATEEYDSYLSLGPDDPCRCLPTENILGFSICPFPHPMRPKCGLHYQVNGSVQKLESGAALCGRLLLTLLSINSSCSNFGLLILSEAKWFFNKRQWKETKYSWNAGTKTNGSSFTTNIDGRWAQPRRPKKKTLYEQQIISSGLVQPVCNWQVNAQGCSAC